MEQKMNETKKDFDGTYKIMLMDLDEKTQNLQDTLQSLAQVEKHLDKEIANKSVCMHMLVCIFSFFEKEAFFERKNSKP